MIVNKDNLGLYGWTSMDLVKGDIKAVAVDFPGLDTYAMKSKPTPLDLELAANGIITIVPFFGPWSWMNRETVRLVDEIVSVVYEVKGLDENIPLISFGGSMGGLCALVYSIYGRKTPSACYANCPVCDLPYHHTERRDLPRTMYSAFGHYECGMDEALKLTSPVHQADKLPRIPYLIIHNDGDPAVSNEKHSKVLVEKMKELGHDVEYVVPKCEWHGTFNDFSMYRKGVDFIISSSK